MSTDIYRVSRRMKGTGATHRVRLEAARKLDAAAANKCLRRTLLQVLLPSLGLRSLLDLFQTGIGTVDPIPRLTDLGRTQGDRARNFFASRH